VQFAACNKLVSPVCLPAFYHFMGVEFVQTTSAKESQKSNLCANGVIICNIYCKNWLTCYFIINDFTSSALEIAAASSSSGFVSFRRRIYQNIEATYHAFTLSSNEREEKFSKQQATITFLQAIK